METFCRAYAPTVPVTIELAHDVTDAAVTEIRSAFAEHIGPATPVYRGTSDVYHDQHRRIQPVEWYGSVEAAQAAGLRACKVCKPGEAAAPVGRALRVSPRPAIMERAAEVLEAPRRL